VLAEPFGATVHVVEPEGGGGDGVVDAPMTRDTG
jgi:hypothetical protein